MSTQIAIRKLFSFITDYETLACLLTGNIRISPDSINVNIVGYIIQKIANGEILVKIVVGVPDPFNPPTEGPTDAQQLEQFRKNLHSLKIKFVESNIIQLVGAGANNTRLYTTTLFCNCIPFKSAFIGEAGSIFIEVAQKDIEKAASLFSEIDLANPEPALCVNRFNVDQECGVCDKTEDESDQCKIFVKKCPRCVDHKKKDKSCDKPRDKSCDKPRDKPRDKPCDKPSKPCKKPIKKCRCKSKTVHKKNHHDKDKHRVHTDDLFY